MESAAELSVTVSSLRRRVAELEAENARLTHQLAHARSLGLGLGGGGGGGAGAGAFIYCEEHTIIYVRFRFTQQ